MKTKNPFKTVILRAINQMDHDFSLADIQNKVKGDGQQSITRKEINIVINDLMDLDFVRRKSIWKYELNKN